MLSTHTHETILSGLTCPFGAPRVAAMPATAPRRVGPYRILGVLGEGGMGTVYLGEQRQPSRRVAVKVIDGCNGLRRRRIVKRFAAECQALARLSHPNVASMYEVGTTGDECPFVAMELVEGAAITTWCDRRRLGLRARLQLFTTVCAGVRHAHEKGILHRDIKPSNVLVAEVDGRATAKVIDFGIARSLEGPPLADTRMTDDVVLGTPAYMCPEAMDGNGDVDTRSDVYSLGLVLYELLAGVLPFETRGMKVPVFLRLLASERLPLPSVRFAGLAEDRRRKIAGRRGLDERALRRRLRGDLDAIVGKATARDPKRRYSSPADLAADLERHLKREPIEARPPSAPYLLGRVLRRHLGVSVSIALLILALAAGVVARTVEARRANQEAERAHQALAEAQEVSRFLVDLFEVADPERTPDEAVDVRELLDRGAERLRGELADQPLARARFLHTIGEIYTKMSLLEPAEKLVAEALAARRSALPADHPDVVKSLNQLGVIYRLQGRREEAETLLHQVLELREAAPSPDELAVAQALNNWGNALWALKRYEEAESAHRRALAIRERMLGPDHADVGETVNNLGVLLMSRKRRPEAALFLRRALEISEAQLGPDHPRVGSALVNLSLVEAKIGEPEQAVDYARRALALMKKGYGTDHPASVRARIALAGALETVDRWQEAMGLRREILEIRERTMGPDHPDISWARESLARALQRKEDFEAARKALG